MSEYHQTGENGAVTDTLGRVPQHQFRALSFDPDAFMQFVEDEDLSDEDAHALLRAVWEIIVAFVDLGLGIHPVQQAMDNSGSDSTNLPPGFGHVLASMGSVPDNNNQRAVRAGRQRVVPEES